MATDLLSTIRREIDERLSELRPRLAEYEQLLVAVDALLGAGQGRVVPTADPEAASERVTPTASPRLPRRRPEGAQPELALSTVAKPKAPRAARGAAREAILAALDHGSHTVGELAVVTAMSGPNINGNVRRLAAEGAVVKTEREGKTAWALADATD